MPSRQYGLTVVEVQDHVLEGAIGGIVDCRVQSGLVDAVASSDGNLDPTFAAAMTQNPRIRFRTLDVRTALNLTGFNGMYVDAIGGMGDASTVTFGFRRRAAGGKFEEDSFALVMFRGLLIPIGIRASHGQLAELEMEAIPVYDGTNVPLIIESESVAIALGNTPPRLWTVGPWYVNGVLLEGIRDFSIDFGIDVELLEADGMPWPSQVSVKQRRPSFECNTFHLDQVDKETLALIGQARSGITRSFLRRKLEGGANQLDATPGHIRFDVAEGRIFMQDVGGPHPDSAQARIVVTPTRTGATDSVAINTNAVIGTGA